MLSDPDIPQPPRVTEHSVGSVPLWELALHRPEADYQRMAAETIARAHEQGMPGLARLKGPLRGVLSEPGHSPPARFAAARALIVLDDREAAEMLLEQARSGSLLLRQLVEPALAEWNYEGVRAIWHDRLSNTETPRPERLLAIRGLGRVADPTALPPLLDLVHDADQPLNVRLAAAEAAGMIAANGLEPHVSRLLAEPDLTRRLLAIRLMSRHASTAAVEHLQRLGREAEPTVASQALIRLRQIDPALVLPLAEDAMRHADPNVRREGIEAYLSLATPERIAVVGRLLDDPHPGLRGRIRDEFVALTERPELETPIREVSRLVLAGEGWRGHEQAALVLSTLDDEVSAPRLVALLQSPRAEVYETAAWGLRRVAVPETLPAIQEVLGDLTDRRTKEAFPNARDREAAHLCEALGVMGCRPADGLLRRYIPLNLAMGDLSRPAAIWALGKIYEGETNEGLASEFIGRVLDPATMPPETSGVKQMSAVGLARLKAASSIADLQKYIGSPVPASREGMVFRWSLMSLTGQELPFPEPVSVPVGSWFLKPTGQPGSADQ